MAYCTNSDVQAEFKKLNFDSSGITSAEVDEFINQEDAYIDGVISQKYDVPVTASESLKILKTISIHLVAYRVKAILAVKTGIEATDQGGENSLKAMADQKLTQIVEGKLRLRDADLANSYDGVKSFAVSDDIDHIFDRGVDQW